MFIIFCYKFICIHYNLADTSISKNEQDKVKAYVDQKGRSLIVPIPLFVSIPPSSMTSKICSSLFPSNEIRMIVVGDENQGKTTLIQQLQHMGSILKSDPNDDSNEDRDPTCVVELTTLHIPKPTKEQQQQIWMKSTNKFQDFYHFAQSSHDLIYLNVLNII